MMYENVQAADGTAGRSILFEEIDIGTMRLKNRLIVPAMSTRFAGEDGKATEQFTAYHEARAQGGWGLIITENFLIDKGVGVKKELPGLWMDDQIEGYREMTDRIHQAGSRICAQIYHAGRNTHSGITGLHNVGPSPICDPSNREIPHELTVDEIQGIVKKFGEAAYRARQAGFDAVELHGAHGYLIAQFLSPYSNRRGDRYGGTLENRTRFAAEVVREVRKKTGDFPVLFRISAAEFMNQGMNIEQAKAICQILEKAGADAINCSQSGPATFYYTVPSFYVPNGAFVELAAEIKKVVKIPVATVGRINSPELAEEILRSGKADLVAMGRASVADPKLPSKVQKGERESILTCIGCCQGCLGSTLRKETLTCLVNPYAGKESLYHPEAKAEVSKKIVVAGGGISGCEAAVIAAGRGHSVTLIEKEDKLGGQWRAACVPHSKGEFASFLSWQEYTLKRLGVTVKLGTKAVKEAVEKEAPDLILDATGSSPIRLSIPGLETAVRVTFAQDILLGKDPFGIHPLVIGGGQTGAETAAFIAGYGVPVELVELRESVAMDCEPGPKYFLLKELRESRVAIHTSASVEQIQEETVTLLNKGEKRVLDGIDQIIFAVGVRPNTEFRDSMQEAGIPVISIGDTNGVKNGFANVQEAFLKAVEV